MMSIPWWGWCTNTCRPLTRAYRSPSKRNWILCSTPTRDLGIILSRWRHLALRGISTGYIPWGLVHHDGLDYHGPPSQICCTQHPGPHSDWPGQLNGVMRGHRTSHYSPMGLHRVLVWGSRSAPLLWSYGEHETEIPRCRRGTDIIGQGYFSGGCPLSLPGPENRRVAFGFTFHHQQDVYYSA